MGGDDAPRSTVQGAVCAAETGFQILLVGDEAVLHEEISLLGGLPPNVHVHHAPDFVEMEDAPGRSLRHKTDSSLRVAFELACGGQADAIVTMGNTGAALAMGMFVAGRMDGILRPAIAGLIPHAERPVVLLDVGATVDCKPEHLHQFAIMGAALSHTVFGIDQPGVAILSNGTELEKGTELTREAASRLADDPNINFAGYIEPDGLLSGQAEVVVTDGWTGNLFIKTAEAAISHITTALGDAARTSVLAKTGALLLKPSLEKNLSHLDGSVAAGGLLLGIEACALIGHGSADPQAVANTLCFAARLAESGLQDALKRGLTAPLQTP
jgi:glycerol-3-phosphate acyltransferase PlsX